MISQNADYKISLQAALWDVGVLKSLMRRNESGWDAEIEGTKRAHASKGIFLASTGNQLGDLMGLGEVKAAAVQTSVA